MGSTAGALIRSGHPWPAAKPPGKREVHRSTSHFRDPTRLPTGPRQCGGTNGPVRRGLGRLGPGAARVVIVHQPLSQCQRRRVSSSTTTTPSSIGQGAPRPVPQPSDPGLPEEEGMRSPSQGEGFRAGL